MSLVVPKLLAELAQARACRTAATLGVSTSPAVVGDACQDEGVKTTQPPGAGSLEPPTVLISWAHRDADWSAAQTDRRREDVLRLAATLRSQGINADLDLYHDNVDWTRWGPSRVREVDVVLVVASQAWSDAWSGRGDLTRNIGAGAEADVLRSLQTEGRDVLQTKCRILMLPGSRDGEVPDGLHGVQRHRISTFDSPGVEALLRDLTGQPLHRMPPLGQVPVLPPALTDPVERAGQSSEPEPAAAEGGASGALDPASARVRERRNLLLAQLSALPTPQPGEGPALPWFRERARVERELAELPDRVGSHGSRPDAPRRQERDGLAWMEAAGVEVRWIEGAPTGFATYSASASVYVHLVPTPARRITSRVFALASAELASLFRDHAEIPPASGLDVSETDETCVVRLGEGGTMRTGTPSDDGPRGVRLDAVGASSAWAELPRDSMGSVLDPGRLDADIAACVGLAAAALHAAGVGPDQQVAIAAEITPATMITDGTIADLGHRTSASLPGALRNARLRLDAEESLSLGTYLGAPGNLVAETVAQLLLRRWRQR